MKKIVILLSVMLFMVACEKGNEEMKEAKVVVAVYDGKHSVNPVFVPSYFGVTFTTKKLCGISNRLKLSIPVTRVAV